MIKNIKRTKRKMEDFYYQGLSLKNEDNSFFEVAPLILTNLGYFPITGVFRNKSEKLVEVKTKDYNIKVVKDDHTFLKYEKGTQPVWTHLNDLKVGDKIITLSGAQEITEILESGEGNIFDFRVDPTHSYFTNGILSHNSMISLSMMREDDIDLIVYLDSEGGGVTEDFAKFLGIDTSKILYTPIDTIEDLISRMQKVIDIIEKNKSAKSVLMVIDSISMLTTDREKDPTGGQDMGNKAKQTRAFFRQYARKMQKLNICAVMTAHLTENIGGYGPAKSVAGGTILGYIPSVEVRFSRVNKDSDVEKSAKGAQMVKIRAEVIKSRLGTHGKRVSFDLDMKNGLDPYAGIFDILRDYEFVIPGASDLDAQIEEKNIPKRSTGWWVFKPFDNKKTEQLFEFVKENYTPSGKFREDQIKEFCQDERFFAKVSELLASIDIEENEEDEQILTQPEAKKTTRKSSKKKEENEPETVSEGDDVKITKVE